MVNLKVFKIRTYYTNGDVWETKRYSKYGLDDYIASIMQTETSRRVRQRVRPGGNPLCFAW